MGSSKMDDERYLWICLSLGNSTKYDKWASIVIGQSIWPRRILTFQLKRPEYAHDQRVQYLRHFMSACGYHMRT
jgi:hypothetical protein